MAKANEPSLMQCKFGLEGYYKDFIRACGAVTFAGVDASDMYYNGAAVAVLPLPVVAAPVELVSGSAQDDAVALGTGAYTVTVHGLDGNFAYVSETLTMTGVVAVVGTQPFYRIVRLVVNTCGITETNVGNISCQAVGAGQVWDQILAGEGCSASGLITVPAGKTFWLTEWDFTCNVAVGQEYIVKTRLYGEAWLCDFRRHSIIGNQISRDYDPRLALPFPAKTDIKMYASIGGASSVSGCMVGFLTDD